MDRDRIDKLTGLPTGHALDDALASMSMPIAAVFFDIDGFRIVNYEHGHLVGDDILVRLSAWLAEQARSLRGQLFRVAGDKFLLLLSEGTIADATKTANTIVASCPSLPLPNAITLSAVAFAVDRERHGHFREMLDELGEQLYRAELASGRNHSNVVVIETL